VGNPFYIPKQEGAFESMGRMAPLIQAFNDLKLRPKELAMRGRMQTETERSNLATEALQGQGNVLKGQSNRLAEARAGHDTRRLQHDEAQAPAHRKQFGKGDILRLQTSMSKQLGPDVKYFAGPIAYFEGLANKGLTRGEVAETAFNDWPYLQQEYINSMTKRYEAKVKENPAFADSEQGRQMTDQITAIGADTGMKVLGTMFGKSLKSMRDEEQLRRAEIAAKETSAIPPAVKLYDTTEGWQPASGAIGKLKPRTGMEVTTADGTTIRTGVPTGPGKLTNPTKTTVQKKSIEMADEVARLVNIQQDFRPEFLEIGTRWGNFKTAWKEKAGFRIPDDEIEGFKAYTDFRRAAIEDINLYIKRITGAQMSESEAKRLKKARPVAGNGIFDGDSPTEFQTKLEDVLSRGRLSMARFNYYRSQGLTPLQIENVVESVAAVKLKDVPALMDQRANQIGEQLEKANPGLPGDAIMEMVRVQIAEEFGVMQ
jgi:hypothetical protein